MIPVTSDQILKYLKILVESKKAIPREEWLNAAFRLETLRVDEAQLLNKMRQTVAIKRLGLLKAQEKRNVAAADAEVETFEEYLYMRDQEDKLFTIDELVRLAKKNSDNF